MNETVDINDTIDLLTGTAMQILISDEIWRQFGFDKRPRRGRVWYRIFPLRYRLEEYIFRELAAMVVVDLIYGINKSNLLFDTKLLLSIGIIDRFFEATSHMFSNQTFFEGIISTYSSFLGSSRTKLHESHLLKALDFLDEEELQKYTIGIVSLIGTPIFTGSYFIMFDDVIDMIENRTFVNTLHLNMSEELYDHYAHQISDKMLG